MTAVRVPASTANLGPAFDALGMALTLHAELGLADDTDVADRPPRAHVVEETHPAAVAFGAGGGRGRLWVRSPIPMGRGLGYSGAMRIGGLVLAAVQAAGPHDWRAGRPELLGLAADLEGHPDNVAASLYGGVVAVAADRAVQVPLALAPAVVVWVPAMTTSTERSRTALTGTVGFEAAVFNVGRTALLVAALAAGDVGALARATEDRLHQDARFAATVPSRRALADGLEAGAWCGWLSGSGPAVALLCDPADATAIAAALPGEGSVKRLAIDLDGVQVVDPRRGTR